MRVGAHILVYAYYSIDTAIRYWKQFPLGLRWDKNTNEPLKHYVHLNNNCFTKHLSKIGTALYFHVRWRTLKNIVLYHWNFMFVCFLFWSFENGHIRNRLYNVWVKNVFCGHVKDCDRSCAYNFLFHFPITVSVIG